MTERDNYVAEKQRIIENCIDAIRGHLEACEDLFGIVTYLQEQLEVWDDDGYGQLIRTHLSALPEQVEKNIQKARQQFKTAKKREEQEQRQAKQAAQRRAEEAAKLRKEAQQQ